MKRALLSLLIGAALLAGIPAQAFWQSRDSNYDVSAGPAPPSSYVGPGDAVGVAALGAWSCTRGYNAAWATGSNNGCNVRRASDSTTSNIKILSDGTFDVASYNTFVGTDATASCTISGTAVSCSGASATIHVSDPVSGVGLTQPCVVTATNGSTTATAVLFGTSTSCGTVGVAETLTFQVAGFVTKAYDQVGANDLSQATAGLQPQLLPFAKGSLPAVCFASGNVLTKPATIAATQPLTLSTVADQVTTAQGYQLSTANGGTQPRIAQNGAASAFVYGGTVLSGTATFNQWNAYTGVVNGGSSSLVINGTATNGAAGAGVPSNEIDLGAGSAAGGTSMIGCLGEGIIWGIAQNATQYGNLHTNQSAFYGTP